MGKATSIIGEREFAIVDIETTGFSVEHCKIIEISALKIVENQICGQFHAMIKQEHPIPKFICELTGIKDEDVANGKSEDQAISEFAEFLGDLPVVGHNVPFDYHFIDYYYRKILNFGLYNKYFDTLRISKELISDVPNYKLGTLIRYFGIPNLDYHRAENDVLMTYELVKCLSDMNENYRERYIEQIAKSKACCSQFNARKVAIKTKLKSVHSRLLECIFKEMSSKVFYALYPSCDILIMNDNTFSRFCSKDSFDELYEPWLNTAKKRLFEGTLEIYSEKQICELLNLPIIEKGDTNKRKHVSAKEITATTKCFDETHPLFEKNCVFTGTLSRFDRATAMQYVVNVGGHCQNGITKKTDYLILGDNSFCSFIKEGKSNKQKKAEELITNGADLKIISEGTFYILLKNEHEQNQEDRRISAETMSV